MPDKPVVHGQDHRPGGLDPTVPGYWHYVHASSGLPSAWSGATNYVSGNSVTTTAGLFIYTCIQPNTNVQPGVGTNWPIYWIIDVPIFQNGWANEGSGLQNLRYRIVTGRPHILDFNTGAITDYSDHQLEIQGSVNGSRTVSIVFWLPTAYIPQNHLRLPATDDVGGVVPFTVKSDGSVWYGIAP